MNTSNSNTNGTFSSPLMASESTETALTSNRTTVTNTSHTSRVTVVTSHPPPSPSSLPIHNNNEDQFENNTITNSTSDNSTLSIHNNDNSQDKNLRTGTLKSASFNILSTMVGGGCLSLPLAFKQAGNGFFAPLLLLCVAFIVEYSILILVKALHLSQIMTNKTNNNSSSKGKDSYESVACAAFGSNAKYFAMMLVFSICFFTIVGYE
jgi:hypothetical protein